MLIGTEATAHEVLRVGPTVVRAGVGVNDDCFVPRNDAFPQCNGRALFFSERVEACDSLDFFVSFCIKTKRKESGNLVFDINNNLDHIIMPEGRIVYNAYDSTFTVEYHLTDHLGNVRIAFTLPLGEGRGGAAVVQENTYYPFGGLIRDFIYSSNGWTENKLRYNSKELLGEFDLGWYDYGSRYYNPMLGMFMTVDPQAAKMYGHSPYAYGLNNPMLYIDPNGELPVLAWIGIGIAAALGGYSGYKVAEANGYNFGDWQTWGYMLGGAAIGGAAAYTGISVALGGGFMANTAGIMAGSYMNSTGMTMLSGGMMTPSINLGVASFDFGTGKFGYLGKKNNKWYENLGYAMGALANVSDMTSLFWGGGENISANSAKLSQEDWWGHHSLTYNKDGQTNTLVSVGPDSPVDVLDVNGNKLNISQIYKNSIKGAETNWSTYYGEQGTWKLTLNNISTKAINHYMSSVSRWDLLFNSCASHSARALWMAGVPNLFGFHPHFLNAQLMIRQLGIYSSPYLYQIP